MPKPLKVKKPKAQPPVAQTDDEAQGFAEHWPSTNTSSQPVVYQYSESLSSVEIEHMARGDAKVKIKVYQGTSPDTMLELCKTAVAAYRKARKMAMSVSGATE